MILHLSEKVFIFLKLHVGGGMKRVLLASDRVHFERIT